MHAADLLHRDLKPANVALRSGDYGQPVILDLGFAKLLDIESITKYPTLIGTTLYMAPEQLRGEERRGRAISGLSVKWYSKPESAGTPSLPKTNVYLLLRRLAVSSTFQTSLTTFPLTFGTSSNER